MKNAHRHSDVPVRSPQPLIRGLALAVALALPPTAWGQAPAPLPFEAEGVVSQIYLHPDGSGVDLTVFGRVMHVPKGATIHTPTATLTLEQLADPSRFPGRYRDGFLGATAILGGEVVTDADGQSSPLVSDVAIEPAETVLVGPVTGNEAGSMSVLGVPLVKSTDGRLPSDGVHNTFGFAVDPATIPLDVTAEVEGYYGDDGTFYHFMIEAEGGVLVQPDKPQSSVMRARCVAGGGLEIQGASYLPAQARVEFRNPLTNYLFGSTDTTVDIEAPEFGTYRYRVDVSEGEVDSDGACPSRVKAVNLTNNTVAIASVDGVVAPAEVDAPAPNVAPAATHDAAAVFVGLVTEVHLTANDTDVNGNLDPTTVQVMGVPLGLAVQNTLDGDVQVTANEAGSYTFTYTVADTDGAVSAPATVTIDAQPVAMDTVSISRSNYRPDKDRWEIRGSTNRAGVTMTIVLKRTGATIKTVTADATGAWQVDSRNSGVIAASGDVVRATSSGGGSDEEVVNIVR